MLSGMLSEAGIPHETLNAKNNEREAHIIANAGRLGAVTLATNIAGRGVDIILGGAVPDLEEQKKVRELGGLAVVGTERHESRRIDNQLRGRAGRQGDPGSSQFFLSLEDDLMRLFGGERVGRMMETLGIEDDQPIEAGLISKSIESAQHKIEGLNFDMRKHVLEYDDVMNKQRTIVYDKRKQLLAENADLSEPASTRQLSSLGGQILPLFEKEITDAVEAHFAAAAENDGKNDLGILYKELGIFLPLQPADLLETNDSFELTNHLVKVAEREYKAKKEKLGDAVMSQLERLVYLRAIDMLWQEHLDTMEHLRDSVRLRGYGQRDPLQEFKNEGYTLFQQMLAEVNHQVATTVFKVDVAPQPVNKIALPVEKLEGDIGRNSLCPCGSGKKYKKCGLLNTAEHQKNMATK
jgi:preprotein translocase subunit SecA